MNFTTLEAICDRIVPQPADRPPVPLAAMVDAKLHENSGDGYRDHRLPPLREAWRRGLAGIEAEARRRHNVGFAQLDGAEQDALLHAVQEGKIAWRLGRHAAARYFSPSGCCSTSSPSITAIRPRGARSASAARRARAAMSGWISTGATRGRRQKPSPATRSGSAQEKCRCPLIRSAYRAARTGAHPTRSASAAGCRCANTATTKRSISPSSAPAPAAARWPAGWRSWVSQWSASMPAPWWRPLEDFASDEAHQQKLYWTSERVCDGDDPLVLGANNSGSSVGGSTVHFAMVSLRFRPEWFKARSLLGYGADWPLDWREMWGYYGQVEQALKISGPVNYPWGPKRPRYPYRPHELNAAGAGAGARLRGAGDRLGADSARHDLGAARLVAALRLSRLLRAGLRDQRQAERADHLDPARRRSGRGDPRPGDGRPDRDRTQDRPCLSASITTAKAQWRFQRAKNVVVAGYAIETPRLLLNSADLRHPDGLANSSGLVGRNLMVQANQAVYGTMEEEVRWYKGPPSLSLTEHWNYEDKGKDFFGGYCYMAQGPLPMTWAGIIAGARGLWGQALRDEMEKYNHAVGLKIVGEVLPDERNRVTLADETDEYGLKVARVTFSYGENDKRLIRHSMRAMRECLDAAGVHDLWEEDDDTCHLNGTARMGADPRTSVVNADCRSWDVPNLWICDGSVFPTVGGVNPSLTIQAIALRTADRIEELAARGEL